MFCQKATSNLPIPRMISTDEIYDWIKKQLLVYIMEDAK